MRAQNTRSRRALALIVGFVVSACSTGSPATEPASGSTTTTTLGVVAATAVVVGDCLTELTVGSSERIVVSSVRLAPCHLPHEVEAFATFELDPADDYPGRERVVRSADEGCALILDETAPVPGDFGLLTIWPTSESWRNGDRIVVCATFRKDRELIEPPGLFTP